MTDGVRAMRTGNGLSRTPKGNSRQFHGAGPGAESSVLSTVVLDQLISEIPLVFLDTETTGLNPHFGDRVVEIALARFRGDVMENLFDTLVDPRRSIPPSVTRIHGITDSDVQGKPAFAQVARQVREELGGAVIVGHNAPFDLGFLVNEFRIAREEPPDNPVLDTLSLLRSHFRFPSNSLSRVADYLGIKTRNAHRALSDALTTHEVFAYIVGELTARYKARTLEEFLNLQGGNIQWREKDGADFPLPPALDEAFRQNRKLFIRYEDAFGESTERWVSPRAVFMQREIIYLNAYCHLRNEERRFRLDRVIEMRVEE
jgi:DNA polymerase-3 subunit epsilon